MNQVTWSRRVNKLWKLISTITSSLFIWSSITVEYRFRVQEMSMKENFFFYKKKQKTSSEFFDRFLRELKKKNRSQIMFCVKMSQSNDTKAKLQSSHVMWLKWLRWLCHETIKIWLSSMFRLYIKKLLILNRTSSNITMRFIIYTLDNHFEHDIQWKSIMSKISK